MSVYARVMGVVRGPGRRPGGRVEASKRDVTVNGIAACV